MAQALRGNVAGENQELHRKYGEPLDDSLFGYLVLRGKGLTQGNNIRPHRACCSEPSRHLGPSGAQDHLWIQQRGVYQGKKKTDPSSLTENSY